MNLAKIDNILKYILFTAIFLIPFIPFVVYGNLFFPFITGKAFVFRILVELAFAIWLILAIRNSEYRPRVSLVLTLSTIFVAIIGLADFFGENPIKSIWSNFERMEGWVTLIHLWAYLVVVGSSFKTKKIWGNFLNTSLLASAILSFYGIFQLLGFFEVHQGASRLDATLGNSAYFAVYLLVHIFLALFLLAKRKVWNSLSYVYGALILLETFILYHTATRGAILGLIIGLGVTALIVALFEKNQPKLKKIAIGFLVGIVLLVGGFVSIKNTGFVQNSPVLKRFADISLQEATTKSRFVIWDMAFEGFKEKPILGWGQENFNYIFNKYYNPEIYAQEQWFDRTHNVFFDWLIAGGILGLLGYLSLFFAVIYLLVKDKDVNFSVTEKAILIGMLAGYFVHNFFVFDNLISYVLFFSILGYIHSLNSGKLILNFEKETNDNSFIIVAPVIIVLFFASVYLINSKGYLTANHLLEALKPHGDIRVNLEEYQKALSYNSYGNQEVREQLAQFATRVAEADTTTEVKQTVADFAFSEMAKEIERDPNNARSEVISGSMLSSFGAYDMATPHFERANELSPNKPTLLIMLGNVLELQGKVVEAREVYKKSYELNKENKDAAAYYASNLIRLGETEMAEEVLIEAFGTTLVDHPRLIQVYYEKKQLLKVVEILKASLEKNPNNFQSRLSLAAAYVELGQKSNAIEEIKKAMEINPDFKEQGEYYINEIQAGRNP